MNESVMETSGNDKKIHFQNEKKNDRIKNVISWGDCEYGIDEFRFLVLKKPVDLKVEDRDDTR